MQTDILNFLTPGWVGSIIGLVSLLVGTLTYIFTRQRTILAFNYTGKRLLGLATDGLPSDIKISYQNQDVPRLTRTIFVFWNAGEKTISYNDVVMDDSLRLKFHDDTQILAATVLKSSRDVIHIKVVPGVIQNEVTLNFDFLDSNDGAAIEILHTSENLDIEFLGTVRGLPKGMRNFGKIRGNHDISQSLEIAKSPRKFAFISIAVGILITLIGFFVPLEILNKLNEIGNMNAKTVLSMTGLLYTFTGTLLLFLIRRRYPKLLHVNELE